LFPLPSTTLKIETRSTRESRYQITNEQGVIHQINCALQNVVVISSPPKCK